MLVSLVILLGNLILLGVVLYLRQRQYLAQFFARKLLHILSAAGAIGASFVLTQWQFVAITIFFIGLYAILYYRKKLAAIQPTDRLTLGAPLYPIGIATLALPLWDTPRLLWAGIAILGVPDVLAAIVEEYIQVSPVRKIVLRLLTYSLSAVAILILVLPLPFALVLAVLLATVEYASVKGTDNLTIPLAFVFATLFLA